MALVDLVEQELATAISTRDLAEPAPPPADHVGQAFDNAMRTADQWLKTWRRTGSSRHLDTALSCQAISRERFHNLLMAVQADRAEQALRRRQRRDEVEQIKRELWDVLAASRRALHPCPSPT